MSETEAFSAVAPYYDELMKPVPYRMWTSYYLLLLAYQGVKPKQVLDVCCGTGTMCELLVREGLEMSGLDLSAPMIERAREKANEKKLSIRYEVADATNFEMGETYDAALSFFDSLNNLLEPDQLLNAFRSVARHLRPGGSWIFDMNMAYAFEEQMFDQESLKARSKLKYKWVGDWDAKSRIITVNMKFWWDGSEFNEVHRQRAYAEDEVRVLLEQAGFTEVKTFHSYTLEHPRKNSDRLHFTAIKA